MIRYRVVLADDCAPIRQCVSDLLADEFDVVGAAADGAEAVDLVERLRPDAVVFDVMMPGLNGLEAARRVSELRPPPRIVFLSVSDDPACIAAAAQVGGLAYVAKSRMGTDLITVLREVLERHAE